MQIHLDKQQAQSIQNGRPVEVVDPETARALVVLTREQFERVRSALDREVARPAPAVEEVIPPGIRRSQEAYWRDLPELLKRKSRARQWVAYHGDARIGFGRTAAELYRKCMHQQGLRTDQFYIDRVEARALPPWEAEEIDAPFPLGEATIASPGDRPS
jgi:hypothetical protein